MSLKILFFLKYWIGVVFEQWVAYGVIWVHIDEMNHHAKQ
jgi:hypothetical protein